jgi:hypothetical protein
MVKHLPPELLDLLNEVALPALIRRRNDLVLARLQPKVLEVPPPRPSVRRRVVQSVLEGYSDSSERSDVLLEAGVTGEVLEVASTEVDRDEGRDFGGRFDVEEGHEVLVCFRLDGVVEAEVLADVHPAQAFASNGRLERGGVDGKFGEHDRPEEESVVEAGELIARRVGVLGVETLLHVLCEVASEGNARVGGRVLREEPGADLADPVVAPPLIKVEHAESVEGDVEPSKTAVERRKGPRVDPDVVKVEGPRAVEVGEAGGELLDGPAGYALVVRVFLREVEVLEAGHFDGGDAGFGPEAVEVVEGGDGDGRTVDVDGDESRAVEERKVSSGRWEKAKMGRT